MKTFSKRIFKTIISVMLAVLMIVGTTATGFAAIREKIASVGGDNWAITDWTSCYLKGYWDKQFNSSGDVYVNCTANKEYNFEIYNTYDGGTYFDVGGSAGTITDTTSSYQLNSWDSTHAKYKSSTTTYVKFHIVENWMYHSNDGYIKIDITKVPDLSATLTLSPASIMVGGTATATGGQSGGTGSYGSKSYSSNDTSVATVDSSGKITGISAGTADITYSVKDSNTGATKTATQTITVNPVVSFKTGDTIYFDVNDNSKWQDGSALLYVNLADTSGKDISKPATAYQLTRISDDLYEYVFTSDYSGSIRFWRGNSSTLWNCTNTISSNDYKNNNINAIYVNSDPSGTTPQGTQCKIDSIGVSKPSLTVSPTTKSADESTKFTFTGSSSNLSYKRDSTSKTDDFATGTGFSSEYKYYINDSTEPVESPYATTTVGTYKVKAECVYTYDTNKTLTSEKSDEKTFTVTGYEYAITKGAVSHGSDLTTKVNNTAVTKASADSIVVLGVTPNTGYQLTGWNVYKTGDTTTKVTVTNNQFTMPAYPVTVEPIIEAKKLTVTLDLNGINAINTPTDKVTATYGAAMPSATMPVATGYIFNGYFDAKTGGTKYYNADGTSAKAWDKASDTTLYAQWTKHKYNIQIIDKSDNTVLVNKNNVDFETANYNISQNDTTTKFINSIDSVSSGWKYSDGTDFTNASANVKVLYSSGKNTVRVVKVPGTTTDGDTLKIYVNTVDVIKVTNTAKIIDPSNNYSISTIASTFTSNAVNAITYPTIIAGSGNNVTFAYVLNSTYSSGYDFLGWYNEDYSENLSTNATYTINNVTADVVVHPVFVKKLYSNYIKDSGSNNLKPMTFDFEKMLYTSEPIDVSTFNSISVKVHDGNSTSGTNAWGKAENGNTAGIEYTRTQKSDNYYITAYKEGFSAPLTVYYDMSKCTDNQNNITTYVKPTPIENSAVVYLSSGTLSRDDKLEPVSSITSSGSTINTKSYGVSVKNGNDTLEKYITAVQSAGQISVQTQLLGENATKYEVYAYVVYNATKGTVQGVSKVTMDAENTYVASINVSDISYVYPVIKYKDTYAKDHNINQVKIYVDKESLEKSGKTNWGPLVAAYTWQSGDNAPLAGKWPGQLLVPDEEDNTKYYGYLEGSLAGVTVNNFFQSSAPAEIKDLNQHDYEIVQTYDYYDPIQMDAEGYDEVTFAFKDGGDKYHGNYPDSTNTDNYGSLVKNSNLSSTDLAKFNFSKLMWRDGKQMMSITGKKLESNVSVTPIVKVIAKGDYYDNTASHKQTYGVQWFVYSNTGAYLTTVKTEDFFRVESGKSYSVLAEALHSNNSTTYSYEALNNGYVDISYEKMNRKQDTSSGGTKSDIPRLDGQWYGSRMNDDISIKTIVSLKNVSGEYIDSESNVTNYGKAGFVNKETGDVEYTPNPYNAKLEDKTLTVSAAALTDGNDVYKFDGWYYKNQSGEKVKVPDASSQFTITLNNDQTYYAHFSKVEAGQLNVTLQTYQNDVESLLKSHGGSSELQVAIYKYDSSKPGNKGELIVSGDKSRSMSQATAAVSSTENNQVVVEISSTPLRRDKFQAWYTNSTDIDGNPTYEEILTEAGNIGSNSKVTTSFIWKFKDGAERNINIYADVLKVSSYITCQYVYTSITGKQATFTVSSDPDMSASKHIVEGDDNYNEWILTNDQVNGTDLQNNNKPYYPPYRTKHVLRKSDDEKTIYGDYDPADYPGYTESETSNKFVKYIRTWGIDVIHNKTEWNYSEKQFAPQESYLKVYAEQNEPKYDLTATYYSDGNQKIDSATYKQMTLNTLVIFEDVDKELSGVKFAYWKIAGTNPTSDNPKGFLTSEITYGMRLKENINIEAVYSNEKLEGWGPTIDKIEVKREVKDNEGKISDTTYANFELDYKSLSGKVLRDIDNAKYGILLVRKNGEIIPENQSEAISDDTITTKCGEVRSIIGDDNTNLVNAVNAGKSVQQGDGLYYYYDLTGTCPLTSLNRGQYYVPFDSQSSKYVRYYFVSYAWVKIGDDVYVQQVADGNNLCMFNVARGY